MPIDYSGEWDPEQELPAPFLELPDRVYSDHPDWIPENSNAVRHMFSKQNRYFSVGSVWLGVNQKARLTGFIAPHQKIEGTPAAYFGYWESLDDLESNQALFDEFESWAVKNGAKIVYGPINFSTYGMYRIRIDNFTASQFISEPYNPDYYPRLLDELGYEISKTYATSRIPDLTAAAEKNRPSVESLKDQIESEYIIKPVTPDYWVDKIEELYTLSVEIFRENFAYTPITLQDFSKVCGRSFAEKLCQKSSLVAETSEGEIAGMMLSFPDFSPIVNQSAENRIPAEEVSFAAHIDLLPTPKTVLLKTAGVSDKHRGKHLYTYLFNLCALKAAPYYEQALACLFILDNPSRKTVDRMSKDLRHYALFSKEL